MKTLLLILVSIFSFQTLVAQPAVINSKVNPLRPKGAGPNTIDEFHDQLVAGTVKFIGGINATQWLEMAMEGINYSVDRIGFKPLTSIKQVRWMLKRSQIVAAKDLPVAKGDILSSGSLGNKLYWIDNPAVPENYLVFFTESGEFLILAKWDCLNPVCDLRKKASAPTPPPAKIIRDTVWKETVIVEKKYYQPEPEPEVDNRVRFGGMIHGGSVEFTPRYFPDPEPQWHVHLRARGPGYGTMCR